MKYQFEDYVVRNILKHGKRLMEVLTERGDLDLIHGDRDVRAAAGPLGGLLEDMERQVAFQTEDPDGSKVVIKMVPVQGKITAIKVVRDQLGLGLREAKAAVETLPFHIPKSALRDTDEFIRDLRGVGCEVDG